MLQMQCKMQAKPQKRNKNAVFGIVIGMQCDSTKSKPKPQK